MARTILLVDDDALMRRSLAFHLEQAGYHVHTAASAEDALALVQRTPPDLVLLDIGLPEMDGLDALRELKTQHDLPVVFLTARRRELDEVLGLELGADDYITKPFDVDVVLARFLLFDDKRYFFTPGGSVIGYALVRWTAVTLGDPVGPDEDLLPSIQAFSDLCQRNDWMPVFYQTLPSTLDLYKQAGFDAIPIGEEGVVNLETFTLEGKEAKPLRSPINKLTNAGYKFIVHQPPIDDTLLEELRAISDEWLASMHGSEKRFSLGWFEDNYVRNSPIGAVHTPEGWVTAFANFVTEYQLNEITIDLMRRRHEIENGTMEFLFVSLFQWAKAQGYHGFNLGLSALSGVGEQADDPAIERVMHWVYEHINQFYNFKGLHSFKEKFHPEWSPRYLVYPGTANLAQAWLAVVQANSSSDNLLQSYLKRR